MAYFSEKPANIIATNSMFILDEHADLKSIQVGGTFDYNADSSDFDNRLKTYLYLKGVDNNGEIAYLKFTIEPQQKVLLFPEMAGMALNKEGKVLSKNLDYMIFVADIGTRVTYTDTSNSKEICLYNVFVRDNNVFYPNVEQILAHIKSQNSNCLQGEIVKSPDIHVLYSAYTTEQ